MRIGIISPSKLEYLKDVNKNAEDILGKIAEMISDSEIVLTSDKGSVSEFFAKEYLKRKGKKVYVIVPLDDKEFGFSWVNLDLGEQINCGTWRNQPEKLNEECEVIICRGYSVGGLAEIAYSKWFKPKPVYIVKELVSRELPKDSVRDLDLRYVSFKDLGKLLLC